MENVIDNTLKGLINEERIYLGMEFEDKYDLLNKMGDVYLEKGWVTDGYKAAIVKREGLYATGLNLDELGVGDIHFAIPHTDPEHILQPGVVFVQLKKPVEFVTMGTVDTPVQVKVLFMLLLHKDGSQVELLQDIIARASEPDFIKRLETVESKEEALKIIRGE